MWRVEAFAAGQERSRERSKLMVPLTGFGPVEGSSFRAAPEMVPLAFH